MRHQETKKNRLSVRELKAHVLFVLVLWVGGHVPISDLGQLGQCQDGKVNVRGKTWGEGQSVLSLVASLCYCMDGNIWLS